MLKIADTPPVSLNQNAFEKQCKICEDSLKSLRSEIFFYKKLLEIKEQKSGSLQEHRAKQKEMESFCGKRLVKLVHDFSDFNENFSTYRQAPENIFSWDYQEEFAILSARLDVLKKDFQKFKETAYTYIICLYLQNETVKFI